MMIKRTLSESLIQLKDKYPILALTGPRQSGKTTLLKNLFSDYSYVSLENPDNRAFARTDPNGFLLQYSGYAIIDEVQRVPELFSYLQTKVDKDRLMGQYILSGSQNFHLMQGITQSLAGRVAIFKLFPFDFNEMASGDLLQGDYLQNIVRGFYPAIFDRDIKPAIFYSNYFQTYIQRDVTELIAIKDMRLFQNFLSLCAARAGQLLNLNSMANECGISQPTAKAWISALENSYIVFQLYPYHENFNKRVIKSPKLFFYDTGLLCSLLKFRSADQIINHPFKGKLFENMMVSEYIKKMHHLNEPTDVWFWRDSAGHEVDFIIQEGQTLHLIEFKAGHSIMPEMFKGLALFESLAKERILTKTLVYGGLESQNRQAGRVKPWNKLSH